MTGKVGYRGSGTTFERNLREFLSVESPFAFLFLFPRRDNRSPRQTVDCNDLWEFMGKIR